MTGHPRRITRRRFLSIAASAGVMAGTAHWPLPVMAGGGLRIWRGYAMGAETSLTLAGLAGTAFRELQQACLAEIGRLEAVFSLYQEDSALSRLNRQGHLHDPPFALVDCLHLAGYIQHLTGGCFDVTVQPLWALYARYQGNQPLAREREAALRKVGFEAVKITPQTIRFEKPGMAITLNGIAQGYITDRVADLLKARGLTNVLVEMGESRALGAHPAGRAWQIGLRDPDRPESIAGIVPLRDRALATSGGYGTMLGPSMHHLFDPKTGRPFSLYKSLSVMAPTAAEADALSTGLSGLKIENIKEIVEKNANLTVFATDRNGIHWKF